MARWFIRIGFGDLAVVPMVNYEAGGAESGKPAVAADDFAARYAFCRQPFEQ